MDLSVTLRFRSHKLSCSPRIPFSPIEHPLHYQIPITPRFNFKPNRPFSNTTLTVKAMRKPPIEGVSDELNAIASRNLDFAFTRRQVRAAFTELQQQLDHCLFKTAPTGIRTEEWYERNSRGLEIFCKSWMPKPGVPMKATLCFCHGYGDTCTFFFEGIAKRIAASGYGVYAMDYPGFGLSEGLHGYIPNFDYLVDDVIEHYAKIKARPELRELPRFILGQSMGGAVTLKVHLKEPNNWDGVILVAPMCKMVLSKYEMEEENSKRQKSFPEMRWTYYQKPDESHKLKMLNRKIIGLQINQRINGTVHLVRTGSLIAESVKPSAAVLNVLNLLSKVMPKAKLMPQRDLAELAFREPSKRKLAVYNVICYEDQMRLRTGMELLRATQDIESQVQKVSAPLLILHGAEDKLTDPLVSQFLYDKACSKDKALKIYEGGYHCILEGEPDDRILTVHDDIISWLDSRC